MTEPQASLLETITVAPEDGRAIYDAATSELIGYAPEHTVEDLEAALVKAREAQPAWAALGHAKRSQILMDIAQEIEDNAEELAMILTREQGKPLNGPNSRFEVGASAVWTRSAAATALEPEVVVDDEGARAVMTYSPLGVVGAIGPWNWPMMISVWQIAPSLRMGNTVVVKPSEFTPLSVLALAEIYNRHLPEGVLQVVSGGREVGAAMTAHPDLDKIMFTGSTATGRKIIESSSNNLARLTLELGGNDAGIVLPDTNVDAILENLFWGIFINTGQTCAALKRLYVHDSVYDEVVEKLAAMAEAVPMGHGTLHPDMPFGGTKASGYGQEFGAHGLKAVGAPKVVSVPK